MIEAINKKITEIKKSIIKLINRKHFLDFFIAILTIPVLLTVLITNILNLQSKNKQNLNSEKQIIIQTTETKTPTITENKKETIITQETCKKEIGPISITSPEENEEVSDNPVCITIKYDNQNYCSVVWSYRINNGSWSDYNSNSVCLYDMPNGKIKFDLRIQSTVSNDQQVLTRNFTYINNLSATPTAMIN